MKKLSVAASAAVVNGGGLVEKNTDILRARFSASKPHLADPLKRLPGRILLDQFVFHTMARLHNTHQEQTEVSDPFADLLCGTFPTLLGLALIKSPQHME